MKEIKCPHCQQVFSVGESEYAELLNQIKTDTFNEELNRRIAEINKTKEAEQAAALSALELTKSKEQAEKDAQIEAMKQQIEAMKQSVANHVALAVAEKAQKLQAEIAAKQTEILDLKAQLSQHDSEKKLALMEAQQTANQELQRVKDKARELLQARDNEITRLGNEAKLQEQEAMNQVMTIKTQYESKLIRNQEHYQNELKMKDEVIAQYKDFKAKLSTKMIGESLEVYCHNQFDTMVRPYLPQSVFKKDNDVVDGTKGDFVFRDMVDGIESVSIMFEMKNEADDTQVKHKNSDFFKKLDADRNKKGCEYAVLVSLLEQDNDLYNNGIYSVPEYEKMYVVRPQQFLTIISLLVQNGRNTVQVKKELAEAKERDIDVTHFEEKLSNFKRLFGGHVQDAANRYNDAINDIDKAINQLQNMKNNLRLWVEHLYNADKNFDDISIRKLTYKNPTMKAKLDAARAQNSTEEDGGYAVIDNE